MDYDLKVGYACNNKCLHCVVESFRYDRSNNEEVKEFNYKYGEIINIVDNLEPIDNFVVTGGEPTIRKDFMRILRHVRKKAKRVSLQTNGRLLGQYIDDIAKEGLIDYFVIAMHGFEETHNKVTGHKSGNPYQETLASLRKLKEVCGKELKHKMRIEIVLSWLNVNEFVDLADYLIAEGFLNIGISYPHLDGFARTVSLDYARSIGFPYTELSPHIPKLFSLLDKYPNSEIGFEMIPDCVLKDENGNHITNLPHNYYNMSAHNREITVNFPDRPLTENFAEKIKQSYKKFDICNKCTKCCDCVGVWEEYGDMYGSEGLSTIR